MLGRQRSCSQSLMFSDMTSTKNTNNCSFFICASGRQNVVHPNTSCSAWCTSYRAEYTSYSTIVYKLRCIVYKQQCIIIQGTMWSYCSWLNVQENAMSFKKNKQFYCEDLHKLQLATALAAHNRHNVWRRYLRTEYKYLFGVDETSLF